ncbi:TPA: helix-turn-helix domain-containing protein [Enterococcus faecalis]
MFFFKPDKKAVGNRLKKFKEDNNWSLSEMGNRLGVKKPTINAYIRGTNLAPLSVLERASEISGKPVDWFYYGELEDYVRLYLENSQFKKALKNFPDLPKNITSELIRVKNNPKTQVIENIDKYGSGFTSSSFDIPWQSETGYPDVNILEGYTYEGFRRTEEDIIEKSAKKKVGDISSLSENDKLDLTDIVITEAISYFRQFDDFSFEPKKDILTEKMIDEFIDSLVSSYMKKGKENIKFEDQYIVGKLINILASYDDSIEMIDFISENLTGYQTSGFFGRGYNNELITIFQSMRPQLIKLYKKIDQEDYYDWFEK